MRKLLASIAVASALVTVAPVASASVTNTATYNFSDCLSGACGSLSTSVGTLTLTDIVGGGVSFVFTSTSDLFKTSSFIEGLFFNGSRGNFDGNIGSQALSGWDYSRRSRNTVSSPRGYNWDFLFPTSGDRFVSGDTATFSITGTGVDVADFTNADKLAVKLDGLGRFGNRSAWIGGVAAVPEPETYAMFLASIFVIGAIVRRRNRVI